MRVQGCFGPVMVHEAIAGDSVLKSRTVSFSFLHTLAHFADSSPELSEREIIP